MKASNTKPNDSFSASFTAYQKLDFRFLLLRMIASFDADLALVSFTAFDLFGPQTERTDVGGKPFSSFYGINLVAIWDIGKSVEF